MVGWILVSFFFWGLEDDWKQFVWEDGFVGSWGFRLKNTLLLKGLWSCCHLLFNASPSRNHQSHFRRVSRASGNSFTDMRPYGDQLWLFLQQKHLQISKDLKREFLARRIFSHFWSFLRNLCQIPIRWPSLKESLLSQFPETQKMHWSITVSTNWSE